MIFYKVENKGVFFLAAAAAAAGVFISRRRAHPCTETGTHTAAVPKYRQISGEGAGAVSALKGLYHTIGRGSAGGRKYQFPDISFWNNGAGDAPSVISIFVFYKNTDGTKMGFLFYL